LAAEAGVHVETIRYYERRGLLRQPERPSRGYRTYDEEALETLLFVRRAQGVGFSLREIEELLQLRSAQDRPVCDRAREYLRHKMSETEARIKELQAVHSRLEEFAGECEPNRAHSGCGFLDGLGGKEDHSGNR